MSLKVRNLLNITELEGIRLLAGAGGIDKDVINVNVMEAPDIARWLRGGEFLLTSAYFAREEPEKLLSLVEEIYTAKAAALGIKLGRFIPELPREVQELADKLKFPILALPMRLAFADIIAPVLSRITNEQAADIRFSEMVLRSFSQLVVEGGKVDQVLYSLQLFIREDVAFFCLPTRERYISAKNSEFQQFFEERTLKDMQERYFYEKISSGNTIYGYLIVNTPPMSALEDRQWWISLEHARTALLLCVQRDLVTREAERRYRDEFVQDLILNNVRYQKEVWNRAGLFGWNLNGWVRTIVFDIDDYKKHFDSPLGTSYAELEESRQHVFTTIRGMMRRASAKIPYTTMSDMAVFLDFSSDGHKSEITQEVLKHIQEDVKKRSKFTISIGIGRFKENCFLCHESYGEARKAIEMIRPLQGGDNIIFWDSLGIFSFLAPACEGKEAQSFCREQLKPLINFDSEKKGELLHTLDILIKNNWQMKQAAQKLSIHYNTLRYRFDKICELLNSDLSSSEQRLNLNVALKIWKITNNLSI